MSFKERELDMRSRRTVEGIIVERTWRDGEAEAKNGGDMRDAKELNKYILMSYITHNRFADSGAVLVSTCNFYYLRRWFQWC